MKLCCRVLLLNVFWQILNFGVNMVRVHYSLDFVDYRIQKIGDDFCLTKLM